MLLDENVSALHNYWGTVVASEVLDKVSANVTYEPYCATAACTSDYASITDSGSALNGADVSVPSGSTSTSTESVTLLSELTVNVGTNSVVIPEDTTITKDGGGTFDSTLITSSDVATNSLSGLAAGVVADGALQWGVPNMHLVFSNPITITIHVSENLNGTTLNIKTSVDGVTWEDTGITCAVVGGVCSFQTTEASYFVANHTPSASGTQIAGSRSGGGGAARVAALLSPAAQTPAGQVLGVATGQVLGATTLSPAVQAQITLIKSQIAVLIQQLIGLLQAQLAAAVAAGQQ